MMRVSYSSSTLFQGCNRRWFYKKVRKLPIDPDCEEDTTALRVGKCFHQILEDCNHDRRFYKLDLIKKCFADNDITDPTNRGMIMAMVDMYLKLHEKQGLKIRVCEIQIGDDDLIGYIDAIMTDDDDGWYIVDLKTAGRLNNSLLARLSKDPQLNIYSYYVPQIAKMLNLDPDNFRGTRYRVTTKAQIKMNKKESLLEFMNRVKERIESYDICIPAEDLIPEQTYRGFMRIRDKMNETSEMVDEKVTQNFGYCEQYFKPCEYWSRCYGKTFTSGSTQHELFDTKNATKVLAVEDHDFGIL